MSLENAKRFIESTSKDQALQQRLATAAPAKAVDLAIQAGSERGLSFTAEELVASIGARSAGRGEELDENRLNAVAGGLGLSPSQAAASMTANRTPERDSRFLAWLDSLTPEPR